MKIKDIIKVIEAEMPLVYSESWDNSGLQFGNPEQEVSKIITALDFNEDVLNEAIAKNANLIITHHPFIFNPIKKLVSTNFESNLIIRALKNDITLYAAHTNFDNGNDGLNFYVGKLLGLTNLSVLDYTKMPMYNLVTYIPVDNLNQVRDALFSVGIGKIGNYENCSYSNVGEGTFKALDGANPYVGQIDELHCESEVRLEAVVPYHLKNKAVDALLKSHPYEQPAYSIIELDNRYEVAGSGVIGKLENELEEMDFINMVKKTLNANVLRCSKLTNKKISKVAICTGSGAFLLNRAISAGADAFITGDVKYHDFYVPENKLLLIDAGHYETEIFAKHWFKQIVELNFDGISVEETTTQTPVNYF